MKQEIVNLVSMIAAVSFVFVCLTGFLYFAGASGPDSDFFWECETQETYSSNWFKCYNPVQVQTEVSKIISEEGGEILIAELERLTGLDKSIIEKEASKTESYNCRKYLSTKKCYTKLEVNK